MINKRAGTLLSGVLSQHFLVLLSLGTPSLDPTAAKAAGCPGPDNAGTALQSHFLFFSCHVARSLSLWKTRGPFVCQTALTPDSMDCQSDGEVRDWTASRWPPPWGLHPPLLRIQFQPQDSQWAARYKEKTQVEASKAKTNSWMGAGPKEKQGLLVHTAPSWLAASFLWFCNLC